MSSSQMIDWNVATATGVRWARPGPAVSMAEARKVVAELRSLASAVQEPVHDVTGLPGSDVVCNCAGKAGVPNVAPRADDVANNVDFEIRHLGENTT